MTFLEFIISISFLLVLNGFLINGWYRITRFHIVVQPNNTETVEGYLFKWWSYFWEGIKEERQLFYTAEPFANKWKEMERMLHQVAKKFNYENLDYLVAQEEITSDDIDKIERVLKVQVSQTNNMFRLYIEEPVYYFPKWIRNPLSSCVICMSSIYGSLVFWGFVFLVDGAFNWATYKKIAIFAIYCFYLVVLSQISYLLAKKT